MSKTEAVLWVLCMSRTPAEAAIYGAALVEQDRQSGRGGAGAVAPEKTAPVTEQG